MVGRTYRWRKGRCSEGTWRVICRWASIPGVKVVRNVLVENVETGERVSLPWYPAPRRVPDPCGPYTGGMADDFLFVAWNHSGGETYIPADSVGTLTKQCANELSAMVPLVQLVPVTDVG